VLASLQLLTFGADIRYNRAMKHALWFFLALLWVIPLNAQPSSSTARHIISGATLPATCSPNTGDVYFRVTAGPVGALYQCTAPSTWTAVPTSSGGAPPAGSAHACQGYLTSTTFDGSVTNCYEQINAFSTPSAPTAVVTCTPVGMETCSTSYDYVVTTLGVGPTAGSPTLTVMNGPDIPTITNHITVSWAAVTGATLGYQLWREDGPSAVGTGLLATTTSISAQDTGTVIDVDDWFSGDAPTTNYTQGLRTANNLKVAGYAAFGNNVDINYDYSIKYQGPDIKAPISFGQIENPGNGEFAYGLWGTLQLESGSGWASELTSYTNPYSANDFSAETLYGLQVNSYHAAASGLSALLGGVAQLNNFGGVVASATGWGVVSGGGGTISTFTNFSAGGVGSTTYGFFSGINSGVNQWAFYGNGTAAIGLPLVHFADLVAYASRAEVYCDTCTVTSGVDNTCAGSGTGANAVRVNGAWKCWQ
jgi:hypothetical protein